VTLPIVQPLSAGNAVGLWRKKPRLWLKRIKVQYDAAIVTCTIVCAKSIKIAIWLVTFTDSFQ
jgi:hypothetical protein